MCNIRRELQWNLRTYCHVWWMCECVCWLAAREKERTGYHATERSSGRVWRSDSCQYLLDTVNVFVCSIFAVWYFLWLCLTMFINVFDKILFSNWSSWFDFKVQLTLLLDIGMCFKDCVGLVLFVLICYLICQLLYYIVFRIYFSNWHVILVAEIAGKKLSNLASTTTFGFWLACFLYIYPKLEHD